MTMKFDECYIPEPNSGCWIWTANATGDGYGLILVDRKRQYAHRFSYRLHYGELDKALHVLHRCDVPYCVNPDHLFLGTQADNMRDMRRKNRQARLRGSQLGRAAKLRPEEAVGNGESWSHLTQQRQTN